MRKLEYDWEELDWGEEDPSPKRRFDPPKLPRKWLIGILSIACLAVLGSWLLNLNRQRAVEATLIADVQTLLDLEQEAYLAGDGDLFFSFHADIAGWHAQQLRAENLRIVAAGQSVQAARRQGNELWAEASWLEGDQQFNRLLFFSYNNVQLVRTPTFPSYWGPARSSEYHWGNLIIHRADEAFQAEISHHIGAELSRLCGDFCPRMTVTIGDDFAVSSLHNHIRVPSPRLVALTDAGTPGPQFWTLLSERLGVNWTHTTIRFAIPLHQLQFYAQIVDAFHLNQDKIRVELITLDRLPDDDFAMLQLVDAAATTPRNNFNLNDNAFTMTADLIAAGAVMDLTNFAYTDPEFAPGNFYEQIWQGALWEDRLWMVPQSAYLPVIFYDKDAYEIADRPVPSLGWTWDEMLADMYYLSEAQPGWIQWGLSDQRVDLMYAYAYAQASDCQAAVVTDCPTTLTADSRAAALDWYLGLLNDAEYDLEPGGPLHYPQGSSEFERLSATLMTVSSRRHAVFWVEDPVRFEYHRQLNALGVLPFPASEQFDSSTPLWVQGNVISSASSQPTATWEWLQYLSFQQVDASSRHIPSRPSVANQVNFWTNLPWEIDNAMRTAFPFSRPIPFIEQERFSWLQIDGLMAGRTTIEEVTSQSDLRWFQNAQP